MDSHKSKFGVGVVLGAVAGAITALFISPKTGKENREFVSHKVVEIRKLLDETQVEKKVKEIFGDTSKKSKALFMEAKKKLAEKLSVLEEKVRDMGRDKYVQIVDDVVGQFSQERKVSSQTLSRLSKYLVDDFKKFTSPPNQRKKLSPKKSAKKTSKRSSEKKK